MSADDSDPVRISRAVPLEQLREPETDVRMHRPQDQVQSLAASMGDPDVGQLQDILCHPVDYEDAVDEGTEDELHELLQDGHAFRVVDGETRRQAAAYLGWHSLAATITPEPPEDTTIAQLDANTERIEMGEFETVRALYDHREETGKTLAEIGDVTGYSRSYLSNVFSALESHEDIVDAWARPDHPVETSHAVTLKGMLSDHTVQQYAEAGRLSDEDARDRALADVRLMIDVQDKHELTVGEFRKRSKRCVKESLDELEDQRTLEDKRAEGQTEAAEARERDSTPAQTPDHDCVVCGDPSDRKIALDVCRQDYGMLSDMQANGDILMAQAESGQNPGLEAGDSPDGDMTAAEALAGATGISPEDAHGVIHEVRQQAQQAPQGRPDG